MKYRTYIRAGIPLPLQIASAVAWNDMEHVEPARVLNMQKTFV